MKTFSPNENQSPPLGVSFGGVRMEEAPQFTKAFRIGRGPECDICITNEYVSRVHAEAVPERGGWKINDLQSTNGLYLDGQRIESLEISSPTTLRLGIEGPEVVLFPILQREELPKPAGTTVTGQHRIIAQYAARYFAAAQPDEVVGEHTMYLRRAFAQVQSKQRQAHSRQRWIYFGVICLLTLAAVGVTAYAIHLHREVIRQRALAHDLFYAMKSLDVEIVEAERLLLASDKQHGVDAASKYEARRRAMQANYDQVLASQQIYGPQTSEQHRLIMRVARVFGECELDLPPDFEQEVVRYIKYWQTTGRFERDIRLAKEKGYTRKIPQAMLARGLPVQFFYLAMQESDFDPYISGPMTRKGFAKGMWQFVPETAIKYGLHLGPLVDLPRPDPRDERDQDDKATDAASQYLSELYTTDAQASGLLVMACYNWGEDQVLPLVRSMPLNPRQRNFWRLLAEHRGQIPQQTYDYVFYITSAAVIGENPRLFGFNFDNPLYDTAHPVI